MVSDLTDYKLEVGAMFLQKSQYRGWNGVPGALGGDRPGCLGSCPRLAQLRNHCWAPACLGLLACRMGLPPPAPKTKDHRERARARQRTK